MKNAFILILFILGITALVAQQSETPPTGFERVTRTAADQQEAIESARPDIVIIETKADTEVKPIYYNFNKDLLRSTNRILLIKWLKESK